MSREDWYRNKEWNSDIELAFFTKLKRARDKGQYLRIQACTLASIHPKVALRLLDEYFTLPLARDRTQAYVDRANSYLTLGDVDQAILSYEAALAREAEFPKSLTQAYIDLPYLIVSRSLTAHYHRARELLQAHVHRLLFPVDFFKWNACQAPLANVQDQKSEAVRYAKAALEAAHKTSSGFRYHPTIGLVSNEHSDVLARLEIISRA